MDAIESSTAPERDATSRELDTELLSSIRSSGLLIPLSVRRSALERTEFEVVSGKRRYRALQELGFEEVDCFLVDEAETLPPPRNKTGLSALQEQVIIQRAIDRGVSELAISDILGISRNSLWRKLSLVCEIDESAARVLGNERAPLTAYEIARKAVPERQRRIVALMAATQNFGRAYGNCLLAATPKEQLADRYQAKKFRGLSTADVEKLERDREPAESNFLEAASMYGPSLLRLTALRAYGKALLANQVVLTFLKSNPSEPIGELATIFGTDG